MQRLDKKVLVPKNAIRINAFRVECNDVLLSWVYTFITNSKFLIFILVLHIILCFRKLCDSENPFSKELELIASSKSKQTTSSYLSSQSFFLIHKFPNYHLKEPFTITPLFERKEKQDNLLGLTDKQGVIKTRTMALAGAGIEIEGLMTVNLTSCLLIYWSATFPCVCLYV